MNKLYLYVINAYRIMFYVVIAGLFDCVISVFAMFLYIYFGKNKICFRYVFVHLFWKK